MRSVGEVRDLGEGGAGVGGLGGRVGGGGVVLLGPHVVVVEVMLAVTLVPVMPLQLKTRVSYSSGQELQQYNSGGLAQ